MDDEEKDGNGKEKSCENGGKWVLDRRRAGINVGYVSKRGPIDIEEERRDECAQRRIGENVDPERMETADNGDQTTSESAGMEMEPAEQPGMKC